MHPHLNCPICPSLREGEADRKQAQLVDLTIWLREHKSQSNQITAERLLKDFIIGRR